MQQDRRDWVQWIRVLADPSAAQRGFSLEGLEFPAKNNDPVEDEMHGTLQGDTHVQAGKFWVITEEALMRICPRMQAFAQGKDWFFPVEFCDSMVRPAGMEPAQTRDATDEERAEAISTFGSVQTQLANKS